jgi:hypothetical protein
VADLRLPPPTPTLSNLVIDAHKNWLGYSIKNVGPPASDNDVPRARASDILSGRFTIARMPDGPVGAPLVGQGLGVDPAYGNMKLSYLTVDVDKDWNGKRITNVGFAQLPNDVLTLKPAPNSAFLLQSDGGFLLDVYGLESYLFNIAPNGTPTPSTATQPIDRDLSTYASFSTTSTSYVEVWRLDLGSVVDGCLAFKAGIFCNAYVVYLAVDISLDGSTWTQIYSTSYSGTSEYRVYVSFKNQSLRYIRFKIYISQSGLTAYLNLYEVMVFA